MLFPVDWMPALEGAIIPLAAALVNVGVSRDMEGGIGDPSENDFDVGGGDLSSVVDALVGVEGPWAFE